MNLLELLVFAYATHIVVAAVCFFVAGPYRHPVDSEFGRLVVALLWPCTGPAILALKLWSWWRWPRLARAKVVKR